jgi:hypothetical protein
MKKGWSNTQVPGTWLDETLSYGMVSTDHMIDPGST